MRILSVVGRGYYGDPIAVEPMYLYFTDPLRTLGHEVEHFDHFKLRRELGIPACMDHLVQTIHRGGYDLVLYQTSGNETPETNLLQAVSGQTLVVAWNSDDDWQWDQLARYAPAFTYMVTTYPHIYEANRDRYPNLRLSQWGCYEGFGDAIRRKDLGFSFVGSVYGPRNSECRYLRRRANLACFGRGARLARLGIPYFRGAFKLPWLSGRAVPFAEVSRIWNRSRVSYTPLKGGPDGLSLQIKSRVFDMGLSGTLMLCEENPDLARYYTPGEEYVTYATLDDCAEKARWYLAHEVERERIAARYRERTLAEHLWSHRFQALFREIGLAGVAG